jgi:hypothetical protein
MNKKIEWLFLLTLFSTTSTHTIDWNNWWPFSAWSTRNLSADQKTIRNIIKNCSDTGLDTKFNLERFLEKEQPRTLYEWVNFLKINYSIVLARRELETIASYPGDSIAGKTVSGTKKGVTQYWNDQIATYQSQKASLEPRLSFIPNINYSLADYNYLKHECADQILTRLKNAFPYLTETPSLLTPLPADQISILLQILGSVPTAQQNKIKPILEKNSITLVFLFFTFLSITAGPQQKESRMLLLDKITEAAWQSSPDPLKLQSQISQRDALTMQRAEGVRTHSISYDEYESLNSQINALDSAIKQSQATFEQNKKDFKEQFTKNFATHPVNSITLPLSVIQTIISYLKSYYPTLSSS